MLCLVLALLFTEVFEIQSYLEIFKVDTSLTASNCISLRVCCPFWQSGVSVSICPSPECKVGQLGCKPCADQIAALYTEAAGAVVLPWHCQCAAGTRVGVCPYELRCHAEICCSMFHLPKVIEWPPLKF